IDEQFAEDIWDAIQDRLTFICIGHLYPIAHERKRSIRLFHYVSQNIQNEKIRQGVARHLGVPNFMNTLFDLFVQL
ncbi:hypothetical protein A4X13_0g9188, partial [Tilletia indica]